MSDLIIVDITENERNTIDGASIQKDISGSGKIAVKNPSQTSRLWNITCDVKENVNTTLESRELNIGILDPSQEYVKEYEIHNLKEPSLKVVEVFDTEVSISGTINTAFLYKSDNICMLKITLSNPLDTPISSIKLVREIPTFFQDIDIKNPNIGTAGITENEGLKSFNWDIITLEGKQTANLEVACTVNVQDNELKELGNLNVSYIINNYKLSLVNPEIRGLTDSMSGIDRDEGSRPGIWDCNVEFINESDFQVRLEDVKVTHKIPTGIETVVSQAPNRLLNPDQSWEFEFQIESKDVPELNSSIEFTPLYVVITRVLGEISKQSTVYPVLSANIEKTINPPEVDAYANTDMSIENLVMNNGSSNIDVLNIVDEIPQDFIPPSFDQIKITLGKIDISSRQEYTRKLTIEPADQNPDVAHRLVIELINLSQHLIPDSKLVFSYPLLARNPRPPTESLYKTPVKIEVNSPVEGNLFTKMPDEEHES